jgi:L-lactate dehydrogenase complex protein LldG
MSEPLQHSSGNPVLDEVRRALGRSASLKPAPLEPFVEETLQEDLEALLARFSEELAAVGAKLHQARTAEEAGERVAQICATAGGGEVVLSGSSLLAELNLTAQLAAREIAVFAVEDFRAAEKETLIARLAKCSAGVTALDYAIAETGTLVITSDEEQALLVSLLPPVHIAVLRPQQILSTLTEAVNRIAEERMRRAAPTRSTTFITGPSRTSDVELVLSIGVHGPKELHVIVLAE